MVTRLIVGISSQRIEISNHDVIHMKQNIVGQLYLSKIYCFFHSADCNPIGSSWKRHEETKQKCRNLNSSDGGYEVSGI